MNQCDGCARGLPLEDGVHRGEGWDAIGCTADRYVVAEPLSVSEFGAYLKAAQEAFTGSEGNMGAALAAAESTRKDNEDESPATPTGA